MEIIYGINEQDALVFVNQEWEQFALENGGDHLLEAEVVGKPLWGFISDGVARKLYRGVLQQVRRGFILDLTLRCDAPWERRLVQMVVAPGVRSDVEFKTRLLSRKARPVNPLLDPNALRGDGSVFRCCWCNRVAAEIDSWFEVEELPGHLHFSRHEPLPTLEYITCPDCYRKVSDILEGATGMASFRSDWSI